jgi:hypothetical protein
MSVKPIEQLQLGKESTWGTGVAGTVKLMGVKEFSIEQDNDSEVFEELRGSLAPGYIGVVNKIGHKAKLTQFATYDDAPYILDSLFGVATPGGAGPYTRDYLAPLGTSPTLRFNSMLWGDAAGSYRLAGGVCTKATFKAESGKPMEIDSEWIGKTVAAQALAGLNDRTVFPITGPQAVLAIDTWAGTMGATPYTAGWNVEMEIDNGLALKHYLGALAAGGFSQPRLKGKVALTLEYDATSKAWLELHMVAVPLVQLQVRLKFSDTAGRDFMLSFAGMAVKAPKVFDFESEVGVIKMELEGLYHGTFANWFKANTINGVPTLA